ncbi:MAG: DUF3857 domain-containing protein [Balneolaceae bacterium]|nr:DUF3857 domain-containing protein [Balneolaceae bacterium]
MLSVAFSPHSVSAQSGRDHAIPQARFGEIPDSLFRMQVYRPDRTAPYFYAYKEVTITFEEDETSIVAILDYHVRVKVFDAEAREASIVAIPYYFENDIENVEQIRGFTYHPDGSRTPLDPAGIRTINLNARYNVKEFTMPEVVDGAILEYGYRIRRRYIEELPDFYLSHQAPTEIAKATIVYPKYLRYDAIPTDFNGEVQHIEQRIDTSSVPKVFSIPQPDPLVRHHWIAREVPAVEEEAFISSLDDYRGKLKFQLAEFGIPRQQLENSWDIVAAQIRRNRNPWDIIGQNRRAHRLGRQIARRFARAEAAQDSIFRYLNRNTRFDETRAAFSTTGEDSVLGGLPVSQPAINQTLIAMLNGAGIDAWPLLISTRPFGRINRSFPSFYQFNGLVVYSIIDGRSYFMDASFAHSQPGLLPVASYNETGLVLKQDSYEWIEIRPDDSVFSISITLDGALDREGNLIGTIRASHFGYPAQLIREQAANGREERQIVRDALFDGYSDIRLDSIAIRNLKRYDDSVRISARFSIEQYAASFTDGLDYRPMVVGYLMSNPFAEGKRDLPITLDAPELLYLTYTIDLPPGFGLGEGIQNRSIELPGARLNEMYRATAGSVRYKYNIEIVKKQFEPELYPQLLDLYERWVDLSTMSWQIKRK